MPFYMREDIEDVDVPADGAQLVSIWVSKPTVHSKSNDWHRAWQNGAWLELSHSNTDKRHV